MHFESDEDLIPDLNLDFDFLIMEIYQQIQIRPFKRVRVLNICKKLCENVEFRGKLFNFSMSRIPFIAYNLYHMGVFEHNDVIKKLHEICQPLPTLYFFSLYENYSQVLAEMVPKALEYAEYVNMEPKLIQECINNSWIKESLGYKIKYDLENELKTAIMNLDIETYRLCWSILEPMHTPKEKDLLSIAAWYGSIKCFKYLFLITKNKPISLLEYSKFGGSLESIHISENGSNICIENQMEMVCKSRRISIFNWICERISIQVLSPAILCSTQFLYPIIHSLQNGSDINSYDNFTYLFIVFIFYLTYDNSSPCNSIANSGICSILD